jgi:transketolase
VAIACAVPGLQVISPCDPKDVVAAVKHCAVQNDGPVYLRLGKAGEPNLPRNSGPWEFGKLSYIRYGMMGTCLISYGSTVALCLQIGAEHNWSVVNCHTLKPLDEEGLKLIFDSYERVVVIEEHNPDTGLAARIAKFGPVERFGIEDRFIHHYGSHESILAKHGLTKERIVAFLQK